MKVHGNIKCDCSHTQKDHFNTEGCCKKCGCTWFYPNARYIEQMNKRKRENNEVYQRTSY